MITIRHAYRPHSPERLEDPRELPFRRVIGVVSHSCKSQACGASEQKKKAPEMGASFAVSALVAEAYSEM
jgi:hypothetical protein